jgi:hypothetical protein
MAERTPSNDQAAFGVFPQLQRNRSKQDREAAKNVPIDLARGAVAGVLGAPGDIESLVRMLPYLDEKTVLPTSEDIEKRLPLRSETPVSKAATGLGILGGGFYTGPGSPLRVAGALPGALKHGAEEFAKATAAGAPHVMKNVGKANWLSGTNVHVPEGDMWRFKTQPIAGESPAQRIPHHEELLKDPTLNQDQIDRVLYQLEQTKGEAALDKWADSALMGYFKGQLATPDDPVRLFIEKNYANIEAKFAKDQERAAKMAQRAELETDPRKQANIKRQADAMFVQAKDDREVAMQNISHLPPDMLKDIVLDPKSYIKEERVKAGFPAEGMATADPARKWEHQADEAIKVTRAGDIQDAMELQPKLDKALQDQYAVYQKVNDAFGNLLRDKGLDESSIEALVKSMPRSDKADSVGMLGDLLDADSKYLKLLDQDRSFPKFAAKDNPFVAKLDPETKMYSGYMGDLGFEHVMDVLRQDLAAQRLRPDQLNKLSVEQAVKRTQEYNLDLARKMNAERASARANLPVHKEYPDGYKWVQLNQPGNFAAESQAMGHSVKGYEPSKRHPDWVSGSGDEGSDAYGLGGWEAIKSGRAKVYSLVDSRGAPHTTIEVASGAHPIGYSFKGASRELPDTFEYNRNFEEQYPRPTEEQKQAILSRAQDLFKNTSNIERMDAFQMAANEVLGPLPAEIRQIKGKGNAKPIADYIPYVQDFVKGGKWTDVRDFHNTDLVKIDTDSDLAQKIKASGKELSPYVSQDELTQLLKEYGNPPTEGMKRGGVAISHNPDTMMLEVNNKRMKEGGSEDDTKPFFGGAGTKRYAAAKKRAENADVNLLKDPKTYAAVSGLMGEAPDEMGFSVLHPDYEGIRKVADPAFGLGIAAQVAPIVGPLTKGIPVGASIKDVTPMKASEALGKIEGRPLLITQADRTKVGGGFLGGPGFSGLQLTDPEYRAAEAAWAVKNPGTAKTILGGNRAAGKDAVFAAMLGSPTQHQSNQMVFDKLYGEFKKAAKKGELDAELRDKINMRLASAVDKEGNPVFPSDIDILDKNFKKIADTFDRRSIAGHLMGGVQVGGKKGQIIDYDKIIKSTTDPLLIDAPSGAIGNRLFTLSGGVIERPDLHPAFPTILQGEDLGVSFDPVTRDLIMKDFIEKTQREKGRAPGYMDYTRGYPPSQLITEDLLTELQKLGKKKGGTVHKAAGGAISGDDLILEERPL